MAFPASAVQQTTAEMRTVIRSEFNLKLFTESWAFTVVSPFRNPVYPFRPAFTNSLTLVQYIGLPHGILWNLPDNARGCSRGRRFLEVISKPRYSHEE